MLSQPELGSGLGKDVLTGSAFLAEMAKELDNMDTQFRIEDQQLEICEDKVKSVPVYETPLKDRLEKMGNLGLAGQSVGRSPQKSIHELRNGVDVAQNLPENLDLNYPQLKTAINKVYLGDFVQQERNFKASSLFNSGILYKSELVQVNCVTQTKSDANQINMLFSVELVNTSDHEILLKTFDITNIEDIKMSPEYFEGSALGPSEKYQRQFLHKSSPQNPSDIPI